MSDVSYASGREAVDDDALLEVGTAPGFSLVAEIPMQHGAVSGLAVSPDGARLIVTHYGDGHVSLIDTADRVVAQTAIRVDEPFAIADTRRARAYVSTVSAAYDSILAIDIHTDRVVAVYPVAHSVTDLAVSPDGKHVYASRTASNGADVAVLDTETGTVDAIAIADTPGITAGCVRVSRDGRRLYVATNGPSSAELVVIDVRRKQVLSTLEIGSPIRDVALSLNGTTAYVASCGPDLGAVVDVLDIRATATITGTCKVGETVGLLTQLTLSRDGQRAYLVGDDHVTVLSALTYDVVGAIAVDRRPSCVIESPDGNCLYIADYAGGVTAFAIASPPASAQVPTSVDERTAPNQWVLPDLLHFEPMPT